MKLIIQIPCYNEERTLPLTLAALPRQVAGCDEVEWLVVDDGSTDATLAAARAGGVDHIVALHANQGLAGAFTAGIQASLAAGADVIVNTDADNQYCADDIPALVRPILERRAEMVIGRRDRGDDRPTAMMIIKLDEAPSEATLDALREAPGILSVSALTL